MNEMIVIIKMIFFRIEVEICRIFFIFSIFFISFLLFLIWQVAKKHNNTLPRRKWDPALLSFSVYSVPESALKEGGVRRKRKGRQIFFFLKFLFLLECSTREIREPSWSQVKLITSRELCLRELQCIQPR